MGITLVFGLGIAALRLEPARAEMAQERAFSLSLFFFFFVPTITLLMFPCAQLSMVFVRMHT